MCDVTLNQVICHVTLKQVIFDVTLNRVICHVTLNQVKGQQRQEPNITHAGLHEIETRGEDTQSTPPRCQVIGKNDKTCVVVSQLLSARQNVFLALGVQDAIPTQIRWACGCDVEFRVVACFGYPGIATITTVRMRSPNSISVGRTAHEKIANTRVYI